MQKSYFNLKLDYVKKNGKNVGAMHFIYYINKLISTKVDSTYLG